MLVGKRVKLFSKETQSTAENKVCLLDEQSRNSEERTGYGILLLKIRLNMSNLLE
jgi:hypothetical protein